MKIGILTLFHGNCNWGGVLQGYALKTLIETNLPNVEVDLLIYHGCNIVYKNKLKQALQYTPSEILKKTVKKIKSSKNADYKNKLKQRYSLFGQFMEEFTTNPFVYNDETLIEAAKEYDCLISGSDQVWNPNVGWAGFFQQTVTEECKKISYAASIARDDLSKHERGVMIPLIERFDAVSVRERTAKRILDKYIKNGLTVTEVLDPVLTLPRERWVEFARKSSQQFEGRYAVVFFFSESHSYRERISAYCKENNLQLKFIPFARGEYIASDEAGNADRLYDLGPYEFVNLFQNAECVFTDSFHGSVFSIVFEKQFCVFERDKKGKVSKNSRLYDLLEKFHLSDRMVRDVSTLSHVMNGKIDYSEIRGIHEKNKKASLEFLIKELKDCPVKDKHVPSHVGHLEPWKCCGCELCVTQCPFNAITMHQDQEGFYFPSVDESLCVKCGRCLASCLDKKDTENHPKHDSFVGYHKEDTVRADSSSGGVFYALAQAVLRDGGCVYGAAYTDGFQVKHCRISKQEDLCSLMRSKYVQSQMEDVFLQVQDDLNRGVRVLFSGTPCQVAAIRRFLKWNDRNENLILVDFICHGVPSPGVWESYVQHLESKHGGTLTDINFRDKSNGWHNYLFKADGICESHDLNAYMRSFLSNKNIRRSCYQCSFKDESYYSDITLGDAWKIEKDYPDWADDKGTSFFIVRTVRGRMLLENIKDDIEYRGADYGMWGKYNPSLVEPTVMPNGRNAFFVNYSAMDSNDFGLFTVKSR